MNERIAFIGGGNMASAIIGGLIAHGTPAGLIDVVEPMAEARDRLLVGFGIIAQPEAGEFLAQAAMIVWAVKPQTFKEAATQVAAHNQSALHLSVAAGIPSGSIARWLGSERVVRAMPNTPALIGKGITGLFARAGVSTTDQAHVEAVINPTGELVWLDTEDQLDAVTALSGSGPAYMFYFMEAMTQAGVEMGLPQETAYRLAVATFRGAGELAHRSDEAPEVLRQRVTSKGGTTHAALTSMENDQVKAQFVRAMHAAGQRAKTLGEEFGTN